MPLRDQFRPPLDDTRHWEGIHGQWPAMIVMALSQKLPSGYIAEPRVHLGGGAKIDVATFESDRKTQLRAGNGEEGGVATAVWVPSRPTFRVPADLPATAVYEVRVFDAKRGCRLVAAVEIVSPANKDRPEHRRAFVAKCAALLQQNVSVAIVDLIATWRFNLYGELLELIGQMDPWLEPEPPPLYAVACRQTRAEDSWFLETWAHGLALGRPLPTIPLWLADDLAVPLDLEASYEEGCRLLRIP